jgi:hypothetical protein
VNERCKRICEKWERIGKMNKRRRKDLDEDERIIEKIEIMNMEFDKSDEKLKKWMDGKREEIVEMLIVKKMEEIKGMIDENRKLKEKMGEEDKE